MKINSGFACNNSGGTWYYEITDDGYKIYAGDSDHPTYHQYEPYIPDHSKTYEENAIAQCSELAIDYKNEHVSIEDRVTNIEANIDYLMLLTDPDSTSETVTE